MALILGSSIHASPPDTTNKDTTITKNNSDNDNMNNTNPDTITTAHTTKHTMNNTKHCNNYYY